MRRRKIRDIVIELTSLLDIVMILIFALLIKNSKLVEANSQELSELQKENFAMQDELALYEEIADKLGGALEELGEGNLDAVLEKLKNAENQLNAYEYMNDIVSVYTVELENLYNNTSRRLTYGPAYDTNYEPHNISRDDTDEWHHILSSLKLDLKNYIDKELQGSTENKYIYLVFSVDKSKVYSNDYDDIEKALTDFEAKYGDKVRYKLNILKGE